jgi:hydrogenase maturation factor
MSDLPKFEYDGKVFCEVLDVTGFEISEIWDVVDALFQLKEDKKSDIENNHFQVVDAENGNVWISAASDSGSLTCFIDDKYFSSFVGFPEV